MLVVVLRLLKVSIKIFGEYNKILKNFLTVRPVTYFNKNYTKIYTVGSNKIFSFYFILLKSLAVVSKYSHFRNYLCNKQNPANVRILALYIVYSALLIYMMNRINYFKSHKNMTKNTFQFTNLKF